MKNSIQILLFAFMILLPISTSYAVDPFDNIPAPHGLYFLDYPLYSTANKIVDGNGNIIEDHIGLRVFENVFRLAYYGNTLAEHPFVATVLVPIGRVELMGEHDQGLGDITIGTGYWILNDNRSKTWVGAALFIDAPTGNYDPNKKANMGSNVWKIRPTILFAKQAGSFDVEASYKYNIYTNNRDTDIENGAEHIVEGYVGYYFEPQLLFGAHYNIVYGNDEKAGGQRVDASGKRVYQAGFSVNWMVSDSLGLMFENMYDYHTKNVPTAELYMVRLCYKIR